MVVLIFHTFKLTSAHSITSSALSASQYASSVHHRLPWCRIYLTPPLLMMRFSFVANNTCKCYQTKYRQVASFSPTYAIVYASDSSRQPPCTAIPPALPQHANAILRRRADDIVTSDWCRRHSTRDVGLYLVSEAPLAQKLTDDGDIYFIVTGYAILQLRLLTNVATLFRRHLRLKAWFSYWTAMSF